MDAKTIIDAHRAAARLRNVFVRVRMRATRSVPIEHRADLGDVLDEEQGIVERQLKELLRLAGADSVSA